MVWFKRFYDPIILPDGRRLLTYRDAAEYIAALPKAEHDAADWQLAMETLLLVAERNGPEILARNAIMKALNRDVKPTLAPRKKQNESLQDRQVKTAWVYVDTSKQVGDRNYLKVFANRDAADAWFAEHDPEGVAFEYDVVDGWPTFEAENI